MRYRGIGFCGKMGSGKSTAADYIVDNYGASAYSLGYYVRQYLIEELGMDPEEVFTKPTPDHIRAKLQEVGHGMREGDPDFWLRQLMADIELECAPDELIVVDDVRYENEAIALWDKGFLLVELEKPDQEEILYGSDHPSEAGVPYSSIGWSVVAPHGDLQSMYHELDMIMEEEVL